MSVKGLAQAYVLIRNRHDAKSILQIYDEIYAQAGELKVEPTLHKYCDYLEKIFKFMKILLGSAGVAALINPLNVKVLTGELILPYRFQLPFIDAFSVKGYSWNFLYSIVISFYGVLGYTFLDGALLTLIFHHSPFLKCLLISLMNCTTIIT